MFFINLFYVFLIAFVDHDNVAVAQDSITAPSSLGRQLLKKLEVITPENYLSEIASVRLDLENFLEKQNLFCNGELTSGVDQKKNEKIKITPSERKECFEGLQEFQLDYVEKLFDIQKEYIEYLHKARLSDWERSRESMIKSIKSNYSK